MRKISLSSVACRLNYISLVCDWTNSDRLTNNDGKTVINFNYKNLRYSEIRISICNTIDVTIAASACGFLLATEDIASTAPLSQNQAFFRVNDTVWKDVYNRTNVCTQLWVEKKNNYFNVFLSLFRRFRKRLLLFLLNHSFTRYSG